MVEEVKRYLHDALKTISGLHAIVISDREGVPLVRVYDETATDTVALRPNFLASAGVAMEQASKFSLGTSKTLVFIMNQNQVVHFNKAPVVLTMIADEKVNLGLLINLSHELDPLLGELRKCVA